MNTIKLAIADDHALVRKGILSIIQSQIAVTLIAEAENGKELLNALEKALKYPILLL